MDYKVALKQMDFMKKNSKDIRLAAEGWDSDWKILIATILSAQTRDETTIKVAEELFKKYSSLKKLANAKIEDVEVIISSLNFYRNKAKNIVGCAKAIVKDFGGEVPKDEELLIKLPGAGRKTAGVLLSEVGEDGIAVDTHVAYISRKLGWTNKNTPDKIQEDLKKMFPKKYWSRINPTLVRFGKSWTSRKKKDEVLERVKLIN